MEQSKTKAQPSYKLYKRHKEADGITGKKHWGTCHVNNCNWPNKDNRVKYIGELQVVIHKRIQSGAGIIIHTGGKQVQEVGND